MWRNFGIFTGICVLSEIVFQFYKYRFNKSIALEKEKTTEVLFFPDKKVACIKHFTSECESENCSYSHEENSLSKLFQFLNKAVHSVDVCVFVLTCTDLADLLIQAAERGVRVRVITDCEQVDIPGSQIWRLRSQGM
jgi:cardiolipin hydrolase